MFPQCIFSCLKAKRAGSTFKLYDSLYLAQEKKKKKHSWIEHPLMTDLNWRRPEHYMNFNIKQSILYKCCKICEFGSRVTNNCEKKCAYYYNNWILDIRLLN